MNRLINVSALTAALLFSNATVAEDSVSGADRAAIERLHQQDEEATLSHSADQLAKLWDKDAVRFVAGRLAEIGAATIYADDKRWENSDQLAPRNLTGM